MESFCYFLSVKTMSDKIAFTWWGEGDNFIFGSWRFPRLKSYWPILSFTGEEADYLDGPRWDGGYAGRVEHGSLARQSLHHRYPPSPLLLVLITMPVTITRTALLGLDCIVLRSNRPPEKTLVYQTSPKCWHFVILQARRDGGYEWESAECSSGSWLQGE